MARKKGGQKLKDLGKRKPKIKVDLTPHYRPKPPPRGKRTKGPAISSPIRPPAINIIKPSLWGPSDREGRIKPRKSKRKIPAGARSFRGKSGSSPPKSKPPSWIKRGVWPGFQRKRTKMGIRTGASGLSKLVKAMK